MSSLKDENIVVEESMPATPTEQNTSDNAVTEEDSNKAKFQETVKVTRETHTGGGDIIDVGSAESKNSNPQSDHSENEETAHVPSTSELSIEEVDSHRSTNLPGRSGNNESSTKNTPNVRRILLKRRFSRVSKSTVGRSGNVTEEVDSASSPKRRNHKKQMIALFSESDYPRRK